MASGSLYSSFLYSSFWESNSDFSWVDSFASTYWNTQSTLSKSYKSYKESLDAIDAKTSAKLTELANAYLAAINPKFAGDLQGDTANLAQPIQIGNIFSSALEDWRDKDFFAFRLVEGKLYKFSFQAKDDPKASLNIGGYWGYFTLLDGSQEIESVRGSEYEENVITFIPKKTDTYFAKVSAYYPYYSGDYIFSISEVQVPTYTLIISTGSIDEGSTFMTTLQATSVASGTTLYYSLFGTRITTADFSSGALTGSGVVGSDGKFSFSHTVSNDLTTEGDETLLIKLFSDSALTLQVGTTTTVTVKDTSKTPPPIVKDLSGKEVVGVTAERKSSSLSQLTSTVPLKAESSKLLDRYKINDSTSSTSKKASDNDSSFIDFTIKTGALKSLTAEVALDKEVKANAYVKVNPNTGEAFDFTYDPITGLGSELLDTNKNGLVDSLRIHLQDGAKGDVDGLINGEIRDPGLLADAPRQSVYRFFKASKGVHLYSSSEEERAIVNANPEWGYKDEGVAYDALVTQGKALHRFFNAKASYHFMTTNDEEAKTVKANPEWGFSYEGESFSVSTISQLGMSTPVNRFYRVLDGVGQHFYTASADEANNIIAHPEWGYKSEGVGWYV